MVLCCILFWLPGLELAEFIFDCSIPHGEVCFCDGVSLSYKDIFDHGSDRSNTSFVWGGILMCHGACKSFAGLMALRFFLGVGEACLAPGFALITGMFYTRKEQPMR